MMGDPRELLNTPTAECYLVIKKANEQKIGRCGFYKVNLKEIEYASNLRAQIQRW